MRDEQMSEFSALDEVVVALWLEMMWLIGWICGDTLLGQVLIDICGLICIQKIGLAHRLTGWKIFRFSAKEAVAQLQLWGIRQQRKT